MEPVTAEQAAAFVAARYGGEVGDVTALGRGEWSRAYAFARAGQALVIRFSALDEDFRKDALAARFRSAALPVPRILEIGPAYGGHYAVSERAAGRYLDGLDEAGMRAALPSLLTALDAARVADLGGTAGYGVWDAHGVAPHPSWPEALLAAGEDTPALRTHGWRARLATSPTGAAPFTAALAELRALAPDLPDSRHLVHSDLLNFNVLVADGRVSAVVDWGSALWGDFLYDIAWLCFWSAWYPAWQGIDFRQEALRHYAATGLVVPDFDLRLRACLIHIGLDGQVYNAFKERWGAVAAIAQRTLAVARGG